MIRVHDLSKRYGHHVAIDRIGFEVPAGVVAGFLGPNGAGKSTTLRILAGALAASSGSAEVAGIDVLHDPIGAKRALGYLPELPPLYDDMEVGAYLDYAAALKRVADPAAAARDAMQRTGLDHVAHRLIGHLSKGYRQRVGIAQAVVHRPRVLLLDEPSSGLDPAQRVEMRALIRDLCGDGVTVLLSTHVLPEVEASCDHVVIIHQGKVRASAPIAEVAAVAGLRLRVAQPAGLAERLRALPSVLAVDEPADGELLLRCDRSAAPEVARLACAHDLLELSPAGGLESAFLRLTAGSA